MPNLLDRLKTALADRYAIQEELGAGGMATVYLAEDLKHHRKVAVKVLRPELAATLGPERFLREIEVAANLTHPHILPLFDSGDADGFLYYVMPYIEGESLRARLAREGELPIADAVKILREIVDALASAHKHGVVHRDIKPDNVLVSEKHAMVTDFGIAKAVSEATGREKLTTAGVALGTPAYMAPEQASASPHIDHRADIYAVGALAYELLTGRPPFTGTTPQMVLAAHVTEAPEPVTKHRQAVPPVLAQFVMKCLEKKPADRWQSAEELLPHLDSILTPTGGMTPTGTAPVPAVDYEARARQYHPSRVAALFGVASVGALAIVYLLMLQLGLPTWVLYGAIALLVIGLPIMLLTGHRERQNAIATMTGMQVATPTGVQRHLTWRKSLIGGGLAFGGLSLLTVGFMASRLMGIGPGATLVSSGQLGERDRLVLAQFENATNDSTMGESVTELLRIDLSQSPTITVMAPGRVSDLLERMARGRDDELTPELARELAQREGLKAFIAGEVRQVGEGYVIAGRVVSATTGEALATAGTTADDGTKLIKAVDDLSAKLREQIGESLRSVRADAPLERLTTTSLEALRLYTQAARVSNEGDYRRGIALLEEAVTRDTLFAMAYRRLGTFKTNPNFIAQFGVSGDSALRRAYALRSRVSDRERYQIEASYASRVENSAEGMVTSLLALLEKYPDDATALNNIGIAFGSLGRFGERDQMHRRAIDAGVARSLTYSNHGFFLINKGDLATADTILQMFAERYPASSGVAGMRADLADARGDWEEVERVANEMLTDRPSEEPWARTWLSSLAEREGRLADATRHGDLGIRAQARLQNMSDGERDFQIAMLRAEREVWFAEDRTQLRRRIDQLVTSNEEMAVDVPAQTRGFRLGRFVGANVLVDRPSEAEALLEEAIDLIPRNIIETTGGRNFVGRSRAAIAAAQGDPMHAVELRHERRTASDCAACDLVEIASYFDQAGEADSALIYYERWVNTPWGNDPRWLPVAYRRLGELYEDKDDLEKAIGYYDRFVELWDNADAQLQPIVEDVRGRMARLVGERR